MVSIALALQCILQLYKLINIFSIKCYFRANLRTVVTKNRIFWSITQVKLKSEIHSPGNFLLLKLIGEVGAILIRVAVLIISASNIRNRRDYTYFHN